ncbi:hypothetical protein VHA01S_024_00080 [Vibrio halioticoli NBRC 102217]|uniref:Carbamoyltransferase Kae1-like domain-containing protein n=1 Tax=Vibrio halioticoli NBRC 102217 TaxID=1219072 RepID=V5F378_9VIBR|nr:hypothetical protein [Vibrio halioticoli]GAD89614.1 hypothetical protein VHA01S_024_00080 [Vibrio halioticoli NBRC 102217]
MIIRFSFFTTKAIALYAKQCNALLQRNLVHSVYRDKRGYHLEAVGEQEHITELASVIGESFPLSCWLTGTDIVAVDEFKGSQAPLKIPSSSKARHYCEHCKDELTQPCEICDAQAITELVINKRHVSLSSKCDAQLENELRPEIDLFIENGQMHIEHDDITQAWSRLNAIRLQDERLVFANIAHLQQACVVNERDLQLLLSLEKPSLRLAIKPEFIQQYNLPLASYVVSLPTSKCDYVLAQACAKQGVFAFALQCGDQAAQLLKFGQQVLLHANAPEPQPLISHPAVQTSITALGLSASWEKGKLFIKRDHNSLPLPRPWLSAAYALENIRQRDRFSKKCAVLFLDNQQPSGLLQRASDTSSNRYQWLFEVPRPAQGLSLTQLLNDITGNDPSSQLLVDDFISSNPELIKNAPVTNASLSDMLGLLAMILGLTDSQSTLQQGCNRAIAHVMSHRFATFPRIQFELASEGDALSIDWSKAFQSVLSYRAAMSDDNTVIIAGFLDSLADYLCQWIEKLDQHIGFEKVTLAGNEFDNPIFTEMLRLRLSKNVALVHENDSDLKEMNLVFGAMYVAENAQLIRD